MIGGAAAPQHQWASRLWGDCFYLSISCSLKVGLYRTQPWPRTRFAALAKEK